MGELPRLRKRLGRHQDGAGGVVQSERIWIAQCTWECMGVGEGLLARELLWGTYGREGMDE